MTRLLKIFTDAVTLGKILSEKWTEFVRNAAVQHLVAAASADVTIHLLHVMSAVQDLVT